MFALFALAIAAVGIYGVVSCSGGARTREIGVRLALGATRHNVMGMVLRETLGRLLAGGLLICTAAARARRTLVFQTAPTDTMTYGTSSSCSRRSACLRP